MIKTIDKKRSGSLKKKKLMSVIVLVGVLMFTLIVYAGVIYQSGPNIVTSTETMQIRYVGTIQLSSSHNDSGRSAYMGFVRYYILGGRDTGKIYTPVSGLDGRLVSARVSFLDSLDPNAPSTRFRYKIYFAPFGMAPHGSPISVLSETIEMESER